MTDRFLRMTRRFDASPEDVFDAWTNPDLVTLWLFHSPHNEGHTATLDARPGGEWRISDKRGGVEYVAHGEYLEVDRPRKLVFTFGMAQFSPDFDTVTVELRPDDGGCVMTFTQQGVGIADELSKLAEGELGGTEHGWALMFLGLDAVARTGKLDFSDFLT